MIGQFLDFGTVWYYSDGIASVLSHGLVSSAMRVAIQQLTKEALIVAVAIEGVDLAAVRLNITCSMPQRSDLFLVPEPLLTSSKL